MVLGQSLNLHFVLMLRTVDPGPPIPEVSATWPVLPSTVCIVVVAPSICPRVRLIAVSTTRLSNLQSDHRSRVALARNVCGLSGEKLTKFNY